MKKINKHGLTLIEILVSVGLIATLTLFLFNLLIDVRYDSEYSIYARSNQINRISIIKTIQEDFINKGVNLNSISSYFSSTHTLTIPFLNSTSTILEVKEDYIRYGTHKWLIDKDNDYTRYDVNNLSVKISSRNSCSPKLNIDTNYDGLCDVNCDVNGNGLLDGADRYINYSYQACSKFQYLKITIPVLTSNDKNVVVDDLELFYIGQI